MKRIVRFFLSKYFIFAFIILLELLLPTLILVGLWQRSVYFSVILAAADLLVLFSLICLDANPEYKLSWLGAVFLLPLFGAVLYLIFYRRRLTRREARLVDSLFASLAPDTADEALRALSLRDPLAAGKALAILDTDPLASVLSGTASRYFDSGEAMLRAMLADLCRAERFIFLEYFIVEDGVMWRSIFDALKQRAALGVEVRLLYDDVGCMGRMDKGTQRELRASGIRLAVFGRIVPSASSVHNNRDHRKICVIDGRVAYTGSINIADEYIGRDGRLGTWRDGGVRVEGAAASGFVRLFLFSFGLATGRVESIGDYPSPPCDMGEGGYYIPLGSGPYPLYKRQVGKRAIIDIVNQARRYVYMSTPYLIIDYDLTEALVGAVRRGVDVRITTPGAADKPTVKIMTKSSYPYLVGSGVKIYEYSGFIHEKLVVSDDEYALVGTINLDYRSLVHHYEDAVWIYGSNTVISIREGYMKTLSVSRKMGKNEAKLNFSERLVRGAVRLFAPLL